MRLDEMRSEGMGQDAKRCVETWGGGGVLPYISYKGMCLPKGYGF